MRGLSKFLDNRDKIDFKKRVLLALLLDTNTISLDFLSLANTISLDWYSIRLRLSVSFLLFLISN